MKKLDNLSELSGDQQKLMDDTFGEQRKNSQQVPRRVLRRRASRRAPTKGKARPASNRTPRGRAASRSPAVQAASKAICRGRLQAIKPTVAAA